MARLDWVSFVVGAGIASACADPAFDLDEARSEHEDGPEATAGKMIGSPAVPSGNHGGRANTTADASPLGAQSTGATGRVGGTCSNGTLAPDVASIPQGGSAQVPFAVKGAKIQGGVTGTPGLPLVPGVPSAEGYRTADSRDSPGDRTRATSGESTAAIDGTSTPSVETTSATDGASTPSVETTSATDGASTTSGESTAASDGASTTSGESTAASDDVSATVDALLAALGGVSVTSEELLAALGGVNRTSVALIGALGLVGAASSESTTTLGGDSSPRGAPSQLLRDAQATDEESMDLLDDDLDTDDGSTVPAIDMRNTGGAAKGTRRYRWCLPNTHFCGLGSVPESVRRCSSTGLASSLVKVCSVTQFCKADSERSVVSCVGMLCVPDQPVCRGRVATFCNSRGSGYVAGGIACASNETCTAGQCRSVADHGGAATTSDEPGARQAGEDWDAYDSFELAQHRPLREIEMFLDSTKNGQDVYWVVSESTTQTGDFSEIYYGLTANTIGGYTSVWASSGPLDVPLVAGRYYAIGASLPGSGIPSPIVRAWLTGYGGRSLRRGEPQVLLSGSQESNRSAILSGRPM
jgi:hypothetical protein